MSWDIILLNSTEKIISIENLNEGKLVPIDFDKILHQSLSENYIDKDINFYFDDEPTSIKTISLYSEKALFKIVEIAKINNWQIFDISLEQMLNLKNPALNGYNNHQRYVSKVMKNI